MRNGAFFLHLFFVASLCSAQQVWYEAYDAALKDIQGKNWSLAEQRLKAALGEQPAQGKKVRAYGTVFIKYFPEYYLGIVYFNQGKHQEALEYFLRVQNKGLITKGDAEYAELSRMTQLAASKLSPTGSPELQFAELYGQAEKALESSNFEESRSKAKQALSLGVDDSKAQNLIRRADIAEKTQLLRNALQQNDLASAERLSAQLKTLDPGNPELKRYDEIKQSAARKSEEAGRFAALLEQSDREFVAGNFARSRELAEEASRLPGANAEQVIDRIKRIESAQRERKAVDSKADFADDLNQIGLATAAGNYSRARVLLKEAVARGLPAGPSAEAVRKIETGEKLQSLRTSIHNADLRTSQLNVEEMEKLDPRNKDLPGLRQSVAILAFYSGDYNQARTLLESEPASGRDTAFRRFYLGCTYAALAYFGGTDSESWVKKAREQFRIARKMDASLAFDRKYISPRILEVLEQRTD